MQTMDALVELSAAKLPRLSQLKVGVCPVRCSTSVHFPFAAMARLSAGLPRADYAQLPLVDGADRSKPAGVAAAAALL